MAFESFNGELIMKLLNLGKKCEGKCIEDCHQCPYKDECDYMWVKSYIQSNPLLGFVAPVELKLYLKNKHVASVTGNKDFVGFEASHSKKQVRIQFIFVDEELRNQGIAKQLINYVRETYPSYKVHLITYAEKSSNDFWAHNAKLVGEKMSRNNKNKLNIYEIEPLRSDLVELW